ncbi:redox-sensing transcriptional repressor Rex [Telmatobacter bradus]|uniref:redox-sensing transcriptional repressor Rex n=1 Tax=Telmatobacter bradus TaxID=474953 RepID=UPI003B427D57
MGIDRNLSYGLSGAPRQTSSIPQASLRRLPQYHHYLIELETKGILQVSASLIGRDLNCVPVQVRKDLQYTGIVGKPKTGYTVRELIQAIETFLGWNNVNEAFLVGVGNLGTALLGHERFSKFGLRIVAAFDRDPSKVGQKIYDKSVFSLDKLCDLAPRMSIHLGIITTPAEAAQEVADLMVDAGILAIWNFSPGRLRVPDHIFVHNEDLYASLASLSWKLARRFHVSAQEDDAVPTAEAAPEEQEIAAEELAQDDLVLEMETESRD